MSPAAAPNNISAEDFKFVREVLLRHAALVLEPGKEYLVQARLEPVAHRAGLASAHEYLDRVRAANTLDARQALVEALTIHETSFFRDWKPFQAIRDVLLPKLIAARRPTRSLLIWSAACSTGQEPYSLAMLIRDHCPELVDWNVKILATDLSNEVLARARAGRFGQLEVNRGLPAPALLKHFERDGLDWVAREPLRKLIEFRQLNLSGGWPIPIGIDLILMRNVLIYFSEETRRNIIGRVKRYVRPDGYLVLGSGESTINCGDAFERLKLDGASCFNPIH